MAIGCGGFTLRLPLRLMLAPFSLVTPVEILVQKVQPLDE